MVYAKLFSTTDGIKAMVREINEYIQSQPLLQIVSTIQIDDYHILIFFNSPLGQP